MKKLFILLTFALMAGCASHNQITLGNGQKINCDEKVWEASDGVVTVGLNDYRADKSQGEQVCINHNTDQSCSEWIDSKSYVQRVTGLKNILLNGSVSNETDTKAGLIKPQSVSVLYSINEAVHEKYTATVCKNEK